MENYRVIWMRVFLIGGYRFNMSIYTMTIQIRCEAENEEEAQQYAADFQFALMQGKKVKQDRIRQVLWPRVDYYSSTERHHQEMFNPDSLKDRINDKR